MSTKKEIVIDGEKWIFDLETGTIYKNATMIPEGTGYLPMSGRFGDYPVYEFRGVIYFEKDKKNYKIKGDEAVEISKKEFTEVKQYRSINKKDPSFKQNIYRCVVSVLIEEIMKTKYNIKISFPFEPAHFITRYSKRFTPEIDNLVKLLVEDVIIELPSQLKMKTVKQDIRKIYKKMYFINSNFLDELVTKIYLNDKDSFAYIRKYVFSKRDLASKQSPPMTKRSLLEDFRNEIIVAKHSEDNMHKYEVYRTDAFHKKSEITNNPPSDENKRGKNR